MKQDTLNRFYLISSIFLVVVLAACEPQQNGQQSSDTTTARSNTPPGTAAVVLSKLSPCKPTSGNNCELETYNTARVQSTVSLTDPGTYQYHYEISNPADSPIASIYRFSIPIACNSSQHAIQAPYGWYQIMSVFDGVLYFSTTQANGIAPGASALFSFEIACAPSQIYVKVGTESLRAYAPVGTGLTMLTHGFVTGEFKSPLSYWQPDEDRTLGQLLMAYAKYGQPNVSPSASGKVLAYFPVNGYATDFSNTAGITLDGSKEQVLLFDWIGLSNEIEGGQVEASADSFFASLVQQGYIDPSTCSMQRPMHFIGHSRGTSVTSELIQRLGMYKIPVSYVTYLDPHDFGQPWIADDEYFHDPAVQVWDNVLYADNYWQSNDPQQSGQNPAGRQLPQIVDYFNDTFRDKQFTFTTNPFVRPHTLVINEYWNLMKNNDNSMGLTAWLKQGGYSRTTVDGAIVSPANPLGREASCPESNPVCWANLKRFACDHGGNNGDPCTTNVPPTYDNDGGIADHDENLAILYNGNFQVPDADRTLNKNSGGAEWGSMAGWSGHGGAGWADRKPIGPESDRDYWLELGNIDGFARHNRFYLPRSITGLKFDYCGGGDLKLLMNGFTLKTFPARSCNGSDWPPEIHVDRQVFEPFVGTVATVEFWGNDVALDHIQFTGPMGAQPPVVHKNATGCTNLSQPIVAECNSYQGTQLTLCGDVQNRMGNQITATWGVDSEPVTSNHLIPMKPGTFRSSFTHMFPVSTNPLSVDLTATDGCSIRGNHYGYGATTVHIVDTKPPVVNASTDVAMLWPPNGKFVDVGLKTSIMDICDPEPKVELLAYASNSTAAGSPRDTAARLDNTSLELRAVKDIPADGLVYLLVVRATDHSNNVGYSCRTVVAPKNHTGNAVSDIAAAAENAQQICEFTGAAPADYKKIAQIDLTGQN